MIIDYQLCKEKTVTEKIDTMIESSPLSSTIDWLSMQSRIKHKQLLTYGALEGRLKEIYKTISPEIFVDRQKTFKRIKKALLKKHNINESKLKRFLTNETMLENLAREIYEMLNS
jgi:hypothetical protein